MKTCRMYSLLASFVMSVVCMCGEAAASNETHHMFVIPTLTVLRSVCALASGRNLIEDPRLGKYLLPEDVMLLQKDISKSDARDCKRPIEAVAQLAGHGVPPLAGTDQHNPGTTPGASLHGELEFLVEAGLNPIQALKAVTSAPAKSFRLTDRGEIAAALRADLVLAEGNPTVDIKATRDIVAVWKDGVEFDRDAWLAGARFLGSGSDVASE